jgi:hypothetical protein
MNASRFAALALTAVLFPSLSICRLLYGPAIRQLAND